jgi:glycosyltransferase involved in cell wall biosynthesis
MNKVPIVSIVMPTYNVEQYLPAAIESVLGQTFTDWELLVVDDGSTDSSNNVATQYAARDSRIKVLKKENGGLSDARNFGLERANGDYVHFFDSDDLIQPDFYEKLIASIKQNDADIVVCGYFKDFEQEYGGIISYEINCPNSVFAPQNDDSLFDFFTSVFNYAWNKLFKISFLRTHSLFFEKGLSIIEDKEFMSRVVDKDPIISLSSYLGYRYQVRNRSTLGNSYSDNLVDCQLRGILLQYHIFDKFYKDNNVLCQDKGRISFVTAKWILHCIYSYSNLSTKQKIDLVSLIINDKSINDYLSFYKPNKKRDILLKYLIINNFPRLIHFLYKFT